MAEVEGQGGPRREHAFDLVGGHGPDLAALCRAGPALVARTEGVGVSAAMPGGAPEVLFSTDAAGAVLEAAQADFGEGPCRDAAGGLPVRAGDLSDETWRLRWPRFTAAALAAGVRSVCALPLHAGGVRHAGAVDLYRHAPCDWSGTEHSAATFAAAAAELITLRRLGLDLRDAFSAGRVGEVILGVAGGAPSGSLPGADLAVAGPLVCWFDLVAIRMVRSRVGLFGARHGLSGAHLHRFVLAVHEAMTNAVRHGGGHGQLVLWRRGDRLWCEVSDHGPGITAAGPLPRRSTAGARVRAGAGPVAPGGLWLIHRACSSLDVTGDATGTRLLLSQVVTVTRP